MARVQLDVSVCAAEIVTDVPKYEENLRKISIT